MSETSALESLYNEDLYQIPSRIVFVIPQPWEELSEAERTTLSKMISALKLSINGIQIITRKTFSMESLKAFAPGKVVALGSAFESASKPYENFTLDGVSIVIADSLTALDDTKKKNLWLALKQMFGILTI